MITIQELENTAKHLELLDAIRYELKRIADQLEETNKTR